MFIKSDDSTGTLISAQNITVTRGGQHILKDVSLNVYMQDFITIIGPNGAGKSMLLKCILGFYKPNHGYIEMKKSLRIGYVPQRLLPTHNIPITTGRFLSLRKKCDTTSLNHVIEETGISNLLNTALSVLSGGELQRVLLARALLGNPELLILDEPAQNLDIPGQLSFYKLLERVYKERCLSVLMVSHDLHLVMASTKRVVCMYKHICCSGAPCSVAKDPEFMSLFGEEISSMMAVYQHKHMGEKHD